MYYYENGWYYYLGVASFVLAHWEFSYFYFVTSIQVFRTFLKQSKQNELKMRETALTDNSSVLNEPTPDQRDYSEKSSEPTTRHCITFPKQLLFKIINILGCIGVSIMIAFSGIKKY